MNPRLRRLLADVQSLRDEFAGHPAIDIEALGWDPPEQYRITYRVPGVSLDPAGQPVIVDEHQVLVTLGSGYPRQKPFCTCETQVFHPNFGRNAGDEICIGDYWTPAQTLADIVIKIGEMLQYREYNTLSPLNGTAARWASENVTIFPIGHVELYQAEPDISLGTDAAVADVVRLELVLDEGESVSAPEGDSAGDDAAGISA